MESGLIWILAGLIGLGAEMLLPGVYLLWAGLAAIGTGLTIMIADPGFPGIALIYLVFLAAGVAISLRRAPTPLGRKMNTPEAGLAGRGATVLATEGGALRVRLGDSDWPARLPRGIAQPAPGTAVRVEAVDGTILVVRPVEAA